MAQYNDMTQPIADAYVAMATEATFRPKAPSDGFGNITVPESELDLEAEALEYVKAWMQEEDTQKFHIGTASLPNLKALVLAIEGARMCCTSDRARAKKLLQMAADAVPDTE